MIWWLAAQQASAQQDPEEYDRMVEALDEKTEIIDDPKDGYPPIPQMWPGTTNITVPVEGEKPEQWGEVFTFKDFYTQRYTESWVIHHAEELLMGLPTDLQYTGPAMLIDKLPDYQALPDAKEYGLIEFEYMYRTPPNQAAIENLPGTVPWWIAPLRFKVFTVRNGVYTESGALYRERGERDGVVDWRDVWMLWGNYVTPSPSDPDVRTVLELDPHYQDSLKDFLKEQTTYHPMSAFVRTDREVIVPIE